MKPVKNTLRVAKKDGAAAAVPWMTGRDLLNSGLIGMWAERRDVKITEFGRKLRTRATRRVKAS